VSYQYVDEADALSSYILLNSVDNAWERGGMWHTVSNGFESSFDRTMTSNTPSFYNWSIKERLGARELTETSEQGPQVAQLR